MSNEKSTEAPTVAPAVDQTPGNAESNGDYSEIATAFALVSIPFSVLSLVLLGVVLGTRVEGTFDTTDGQQVNGSYVITLSATTVTLIASYSSTIAPIAVGFAMTLIIYSVSNDLIKYSDKGQLDKLPTPYQMGLLIKLRSGGIGSLWPWFQYTFRWNVRHRLSGVVKTLAAAVGVAIFLSYSTSDTLANRSVYSSL
jgi:hypothetical protein